MSDDRAPRVPPHSLELEQAVLAACSLDVRFRRAWRPEADLFHVPAHRALAEALANLDGDHRDEASVLAQLDSAGALERAGGQSGVFAALNCAPVAGDDPWSHVQRLRELKSLRDMLDTVADASASAYQHKSLGDMVARMQEAMRAGSVGLGTKVYSEKEIFRGIAQDMIDGVEVKRVSTGIPSLDRDIGGYFAKTVSIFGAGTSFGKTSYALYLYDKTVGIGKRALIVSFEDPRELCGRRLLARRSRVRAAALRDNKIAESQWGDVLAAAQSASDLPFFVEAIGWSAERAATEIACICAGEGIDLVLVDYIQKIRCQMRQQDRRNEVGYVTQVLTDAVKTSVSGAAGVFFSQLRRPAQPGQEPSKNDLKEAGELENGAENVIVGYLDKDGDPILKLEKGKDGCAGNRYRLKWNDVWCGFEGEAAGEYGGHDTSTPEAHRGHWSEQ